MNKNEPLYKEKSCGYYQNIRYDIACLVPQNPGNKVFELGCGAGATLTELKHDKRAGFVAGMDIIDFGQGKIIDKFVLGNIEAYRDLPFDEEFFDVVICADVLEHLIDPWQSVKKLTRYLKRGGLFVASIPNIRDIRMLFNIAAKGDFRYTKEGIADKTHLRFFCRKNAVELLAGSGLRTKRVIYNYLSFKRSFVNRLTMGAFRDFLAWQYLIVGEKDI